MVTPIEWIELKKFDLVKKAEATLGNSALRAKSFRFKHLRQEGKRTDTQDFFSRAHLLLVQIIFPCSALSY